LKSASITGHSGLNKPPKGTRVAPLIVMTIDDLEKLDLIQVTDAGGLMAYEPNIDDLYRHAATYVDRILKGAKPSDLPVQQPTKFTLAINLKAAKAIGLTISESFLRRADELIQ
jgi:ABC transporter substrate binding protein